MLRVTLMGNLGSDAESRHSAKDTPIAQFRIAVNQVRTNAGGGREESTDWFRINVVGRQAEYASRLLKGQRVLVDGRLQITHFERRDGTPGVGFDVWADEIQNVTGRGPIAETEGGQRMWARWSVSRRMGSWMMICRFETNGQAGRPECLHREGVLSDL